MEKQIPKLQLFNTLTGEKEEFTPLEAGKVRMYVCGPTVYDDAHLGHARCYITWDVLYRFLKFLGYDVTYARNVTDVDDKILKRAAELGVSPHEVAEKNYRNFTADMEALNCLRPNKEPFATRHIPHMIKAIEDLIAKDAAYVTPDGVYYRVASKADYGKLSKKPLDDLRAGARVEVDPNKESPLDFALWKRVDGDEAKKEHHAYDSPWGPGRPGWHIECSAMNHAIFGAQIDIHAGGADLIFPHHENEIAQSESWHGQQFSKYWLHNGFVNVSGEKMSKSLGNFSTIKKLLGRYDANTIRYFLLTNGYRMPVDFNSDSLDRAKDWIIKTRRQLNSLRDTLNIDMSKAFEAPKKSLTAPAISRYPSLQAYVDALSNDLNTAEALATFNKSPIKNQTDYEQALIMLEHLGFDIFHLLGIRATNSFLMARYELSTSNTTPSQEPHFENHPDKSNDTGPEFWINKIYIEDSFLSSFNGTIESIFTNYTNRNVTLDDLGRVVDEVTDLYRAQGFLTTQVFVPPQDIQNGVVRLQVARPHSYLPDDDLITIYKELTGEWLNGEKTPEECLSHILAMRKKAKETKNFQQADAIRKHLTDIGLEVMDYKDGMAAAKDGIEIVRV